MKEHKYAQILRWIADGVEFQWKDSIGVWKDQDHDGSLSSINNWNFSLSEFRIKPKTVMIGSVECESPISEFTGEAWYCEPDGSPSRIGRGVVQTWIDIAIENKRLFATKESALAAHEAITALLTGK